MEPENGAVKPKKIKQTLTDEEKDLLNLIAEMIVQVIYKQTTADERNWIRKDK